MERSILTGEQTLSRSNDIKRYLASHKSLLPNLSRDKTLSSRHIESRPKIFTCARKPAPATYIICAYAARDITQRENITFFNETLVEVYVSTRRSLLKMSKTE